MAGGGTGIIRPGEAPLAHRGVLLLDNAPEFERSVLAVIREPLHDGAVTIARSGTIVRFPAKLTLVVGMAQCPCGSQLGCACTPVQVRRYHSRVTGELGSYISIWLNAAQPEHAVSISSAQASDADTVFAARVAGARDRARRRLQGTPWRLNGDIPGPDLRRSWQPPAEAVAPIMRAVDLGEISIRAACQVIGMAWTLADLAGRARPGPQDCGQALAFQLGVAR
jgi:magnesium chelatase family protein